jgi:hypothetical protein
MRSTFLRWGLSVLTMATIATMVLLVTGWGSAVASNISSVFVTNTSSNPVPITPIGTVPVHEQGTANVNVVNTTSLPVHDTNTDENGNIKVHEQGVATVQFKDPVLTVEAAGTPVNAEIYNAGHTGDQDYVVPDGKVFVIDYINGTSRASQLDVEVDGADGGGFYSFYGTPTDATGCVIPCAAFVFGSHVLITASAGDRITLGVHTDASSELNGELSLVGYLQDA